jgi:hypothetical protein
MQFVKLRGAKRAVYTLQLLRAAAAAAAALRKMPPPLADVEEAKTVKNCDS